MVFANCRGSPGAASRMPSAPTAPSLVGANGIRERPRPSRRCIADTIRSYGPITCWSEWYSRTAGALPALYRGYHPLLRPHHLLERMVFANCRGPPGAASRIPSAPTAPSLVGANGIRELPGPSRRCIADAIRSYGPITCWSEWYSRTAAALPALCRGCHPLLRPHHLLERMVFANCRGPPGAASRIPSAPTAPSLVGANGIRSYAGRACCRRSSWMRKALSRANLRMNS